MSYYDYCSGRRYDNEVEYDPDWMRDASLECVVCGDPVNPDENAPRSAYTGHQLGAKFIHDDCVPKCGES